MHSCKKSSRLKTLNIHNTDANSLKSPQTIVYFSINLINLFARKIHLSTGNEPSNLRFLWLWGESRSRNRFYESLLRPIICHPSTEKGINKILTIKNTNTVTETQKVRNKKFGHSARAARVVPSQRVWVRSRPVSWRHWAAEELCVRPAPAHVPLT